MPVLVEPTHLASSTGVATPGAQQAFVRLDGAGWAFLVPDTFTTAAQVSAWVATNHTDLELQGFRDIGALRDPEIVAPRKATRIGLSLDEPVTGRLLKAVVLGIVQVMNTAGPVTNAQMKAAILAEL